MHECTHKSFLNKHGIEGYSGHEVTTQTSPQGKLWIRISVPVERVLGVSELLLNLKDTLTGICKRVFSECSICVTITSVITALRPKKRL